MAGGGKLSAIFRSQTKTEEFRQTYGVPDDVTLRLPPSGEASTSGGFPENEVEWPIIAITEGGVRFPLHPFLREFLYRCNLRPTQVSINFYRTVMGTLALAEKAGVMLGWEEIFCLYTLTSNAGRYYLKARDARTKFVQFTPDRDGQRGQVVLVGGNYEFQPYEAHTDRVVPRVAGAPGSSLLASRLSFVFLLLFVF